MTDPLPEETALSEGVVSRPAFAEAQRRGRDIGQWVMDQLVVAQNTTARSLQSTKRVLGMSEMGHCRRYVQQSIDGSPAQESVLLKWAAFIGTAVGDLAETEMKRILPDYVWTQTRITVKLSNGVKVTGSGDLGLGQDAIVDFKTRDGLGIVRREGPEFKEMAQISGYLVGAVQMGLLDPENAIGVLLFIDRSGADSTPHTWSVDYETALEILEQVVDRMNEVARAMSAGTLTPRDKPESWCWYTQCKFYSLCWNGYLPTDEITNAEIIEWVEKYDRLRDEEKAVKKMKENARDELRGNEGLTPTKSLRWISKELKSGGFSETIDVRDRTDLPAQIAGDAREEL